MRIVVALDAFKGGMTSFEAGQAARRGILQANPDSKVNVVQVVDAGDDSMLLFKSSEQNVDEIELPTSNLIGRPIKSNYLMLTFKRDPMAIIDTRETSNIDFLPNKSKQEPAKVTSFGLGTQIRDAYQRGVRRIVVMTGNSGINDGGLGMLQAMGLLFHDDQHHLVGNSHNLLDDQFEDIKGLKDLAKAYEKIEIIVASDEDTAYAGLNGVQANMGTKLGLSNSQMQKFDQNMQEVQARFKEELGVDLSKVSGAGADGGVGGALVALGANIRSSFDTMAWLVNLQRQMAGADLIVIGSGDLDYNTNQGKTVENVAKLGYELEIPMVALGSKINGDVDYLKDMNIPIFSTRTTPESDNEEVVDLRQSTKNVKTIMHSIMKLIEIAGSWHFV